ncbi:unnamed protein product, partial [Discosporangium mesarthrocarpum]
MSFVHDKLPPNPKENDKLVEGQAEELEHESSFATPSEGESNQENGTVLYHTMGGGEGKELQPPRSAPISGTQTRLPAASPVLPAGWWREAPSPISKVRLKDPIWESKAGKKLADETSENVCGGAGLQQSNGNQGLLIGSDEVVGPSPLMLASPQELSKAVRVIDGLQRPVPGHPLGLYSPPGGYAPPSPALTISPPLSLKSSPRGLSNTGGISLSEVPVPATQGEDKRQRNNPVLLTKEPQRGICIYPSPVAGIAEDPRRRSPPVPPSPGGPLHRQSPPLRRSSTPPRPSPHGPSSVNRPIPLRRPPVPSPQRPPERVAGGGTGAGIVEGGHVSSSRGGRSVFPSPPRTVTEEGMPSPHHWAAGLAAAEPAAESETIAVAEESAAVAAAERARKGLAQAVKETRVVADPGKGVTNGEVDGAGVEAGAMSWARKGASDREAMMATDELLRVEKGEPAAVATMPQGQGRAG